MNEFVIISKGVFEEMVGKFSRFSDRVNEILGKREEGRLTRWTERWLTPRLGIRFSTSRRTCCVSSGLWRTDERMPPIGERPSECN